MKLSKFFTILGLTTGLVTTQMIGLPNLQVEKVMACAPWNPFCDSNGDGCAEGDFTCNRKLQEELTKASEETWGETGRGLYTSGASTMGEKNKNIPLKALTDYQKRLLRPEFGSLVDRVRIKYGARMLDGWTIKGYKLESASAGMAFCDRIYIKAPFNENDDSQLILLAHELEHSRQCEKFGGMSNFGYRYFKEYKKADLKYENNLLEIEAREVESRFAQYLASLPPSFPSGGVYFTDGNSTFYAPAEDKHCAFNSPGNYEIHQRAFAVQANAGMQQPSQYGQFIGTYSVPGIYFTNGSATFFSNDGSKHCVFQSPQDYQRHQDRNRNNKILNFGLREDVSTFGQFTGACQI